ncbi:hypothetical protein DL89DRAFT_91504 [Linderina pennispora]|uniref:DUF202 domain-containing protein n=1 Tax=Linderina pennispora TaxID=61395 RepID=A0A1Y1WJQ4_9FUNG|nr:uncharacterized protein DL89DRAFT_91504 [Linderina pennispora]ORX73334.1 hypothetical protein DL89DRAFT_91504 [Linderina pennispora]
MSWRVLYTESDSLLQSASRPWSPAGRSVSASSGSTGSTAFDPAAEDRVLGITGIPSEIDNKGSTARDFYAAERNFLSWFRLGLAIMATGMAALADFNGSRNSFPDNIEFSRFYYWLSDFVDQHTTGLGLLLFFPGGCHYCGINGFICSCTCAAGGETPAAAVVRCSPDCSGVYRRYNHHHHRAVHAAVTTSVI